MLKVSEQDFTVLLAISFLILSISAIETSILFEDSAISFLILSMSAVETSILLETWETSPFEIWALCYCVTSDNYEQYIAFNWPIPESHNVHNSYYSQYHLISQLHIQWSQLPMHLRDRQLLLPLIDSKLGCYCLDRYIETTSDILYQQGYKGT